MTAFAAMHHLRRDWTNNGQRSNLVRAGYDVNDLKRTFVAPILRFLPHG